MDNLLVKFFLRILGYKSEYGKKRLVKVVKFRKIMVRIVICVFVFKVFRIGIRYWK